MGLAGEGGHAGGVHVRRQGDGAGLAPADPPGEFHPQVLSGAAGLAQGHGDIGAPGPGQAEGLLQAAADLMVGHGELSAAGIPLGQAHEGHDGGHGHGDGEVQQRGPPLGEAAAPEHGALPTSPRRAVRR